MLHSCVSCVLIWKSDCIVGAVDAEAEEKEMQQAALAAAAAVLNTEVNGAASAGANKAALVTQRKRSVEVLNAAAGQHLDGETAVDKVAEKSAAQKLSEQIQEQQRRAGGAVEQVSDEVAVQQGAGVAAEGQHLDQTVQISLHQQQEQEQPALPALQLQDLTQAEVQQQTAAQAALTSST